MRTVFALIISLTLATGAAASPAKSVPRLIFPVVGTTSYIDDFGAPRAGGAHEGIDIMAARRAPAVAVEAGTVEFWTTSANAGCMLYLHGASGTTYLYIHLNNDLTAHNDNRGTCVAGTAYAPRLKDGARVAAGQLIGYVGDSGDANGIHPHLHFEVHPGDGASVDPYPFLRAWESHRDVPAAAWVRANGELGEQQPGTLVVVKDFLSR
jgi:murein DD-endopeptidase MepM/ murein hydrolase activator NlpD